MSAFLKAIDIHIKKNNADCVYVQIDRPEGEGVTEGGILRGKNLQGRDVVESLVHTIYSLIRNF